MPSVSCVSFQNLLRQLIYRIVGLCKALCYVFFVILNSISYAQLFCKQICIYTHTCIAYIYIYIYMLFFYFKLTEAESSSFAQVTD